MSWNDESDRIVDEALSEYREAEPLAGLEERILRRLDAQSEPRRSMNWRWNAVALAAAGLLLAAWLGWRDWSARGLTQKQHAETSRLSSPNKSQSTSMKQGSAETKAAAGENNRPVDAKTNRADSHNTTIASAPTGPMHSSSVGTAKKDDAMRATSPTAATIAQHSAGATRQEQFPSAAPLTNEERALFAMLQQSPSLGQPAATTGSDSPPRETRETRDANRATTSSATGDADGAKSQSIEDISKNPKVQIDPIEIAPLPDQPSGDF